MKVTRQATRIKAAISRGMATQHPVKLVAILALGAILLAGTGLHVMSNSTAESGSVSLSKDQQRVEESTQERPAVQRVQENVVSNVPSRGIFVIGEYDDNLVFDGTQWKVDDSEHADSKSPVPSYDRQRVEDSIQDRLEVQQILEDMRYYKESTSLSRTPRGPKIIPDDEWRLDSPYQERFDWAVATERADFQREIERLEGEMSAMLAGAREDPSMDPLELDRDLRRLHHQIDLLRLAAMEQQ